MGKTQKRMNTPEIANTGEAIGSQNTAAVASCTGKAEPGGIGSGGPNKPVSPRDAADYIHTMGIEMKDIAESAKLSFLSYLLDLVIEESGAQKRGRL